MAKCPGATATVRSDGGVWKVTWSIVWVVVCHLEGQVASLAFHFRACAVFFVPTGDRPLHGAGIKQAMMPSCLNIALGWKGAWYALRLWSAWRISRGLCVLWMGLSKVLRGCFGDIVSSDFFFKSHFRKWGEMNFRGTGKMRLPDELLKLRGFV